MKGKIKIKCSVHDGFIQRAGDHLSGKGCPKCSKYGYSKVSIEWLESIAKKDNIAIQHALNDGEHIIKDSKYKADGYCEETNTIYEFHGCFFHGCKTCFESDNINAISKISFGELYEKTKAREKFIRSKGYNLITIWEHDYRAQRKNPPRLIIDLMDDIVSSYPTNKQLRKYLLSEGLDMTGITDHNIDEYTNELMKLIFIMMPNRNTIECMI